MAFQQGEIEGQRIGRFVRKPFTLETIGMAIRNELDRNN
jgi:hypothetical protein